jgi:transposase
LNSHVASSSNTVLTLTMLKPPNPVPATELDRKIFDATIPSDHYLRRVKLAVDFEACRDLLAPVYHANLGRPALDPVLLLRLEFLQYHYNLSDREVVEQAQYNMAFRFFLDLNLESPLPHHTVLTYFRQRLGPDKHQEVFDALVARARAQGLVKDRLRLKDATHILANIAIPSTIQLVAQTRQRLLQATRAHAPERVAEDEQRALRIREATTDLSGAERLLQRVTHLRSIVAWVDELVQQPPAAADAALTAALGLAHKVLADREPTTTKDKKDKLISIHDPEARVGKHGDWYKGYLLDAVMDADSELLTAIDVQPANADEAGNAAPLIHQEEAAHHNDVQALSLDGVAFRGDVLQELTDPNGLALEVFVPPSPVTVTEQFPPSAFTLSADGTTLTCPAGETTTQRLRHQDGNSWQFSFGRATCEGCALRPQCTKKLSRGSGRTVSKNDYDALYQAARAKAQTAAYAQVRRQHRRIERKLADLVRWHGARRARYRGRPKVRIQVLLTGMVVNVKRLVSLSTNRDAVACAASAPDWKT